MYKRQAYEAAGGGVEGLRVIRTRGVVQALCNGGNVDLAVGSLLEINTGTYGLIVDAVNANEGTFVSLEVYAAAPLVMCWVDIVNISH